MTHAFWGVLFFIIPVFILLACRKISILEKIGPIIIAYIFGIGIGNLQILPENSDKLQESIVAITILIAIPLLLFSSDIRMWVKIAPKAILSMVLALVSIVLVVTIGHLIFKSDSMPNLYKISGMLVGVYSGGTPNLASLKMMLGVDENTYILVHTYDMFFSTIYLFFLMSIGYRFFTLFLKPAKNRDNQNIDKNQADSYTNFFKNKHIYKLGVAFGIAIAILAAGVGLSLILPESIQMTVIILTITTLGIGISLIKKVREIKYTFNLGMYFILVFSLVVASMADLSKMSNVSSDLFLYIALAVFGSLSLHAILSKIFKIDADTMMITSTALICSPPFVPVIAASIKNKSIILSGLTIGIIGYAVGNYLGFLIANIISTI